MNRTLEYFLVDQLMHPLEAVFDDVPKFCRCRIGLEYNGRKYMGTDDLIPVMHDQKTGRVYAHQLGLGGDEIAAPSSVVKGWWKKGGVTVPGLTFETGSYDCYHVGPNGVRGYKPWHEFDKTQPCSGQLEPSEFDSCWLPISFLDRPGIWRPMAYFPYALYQKAPLRGTESDFEGFGPRIDLGSTKVVTKDQKHRAMVSSAY
jgi:hypothetical protein